MILHFLLLLDSFHSIGKGSLFQKLKESKGTIPGQWQTCPQDGISTYYDLCVARSYNKHPVAHPSSQNLPAHTNTSSSVLVG